MYVTHTQQLKVGVMVVVVWWVGGKTRASGFMFSLEANLPSFPQVYGNIILKSGEIHHGNEKMFGKN